MPAVDTKQIRLHAEAIDNAEKQVHDIAKRLAQVEARYGQDTVAIHVNGVQFSLTSLNSAYRPQLVRGMENIQRECIAILKAQHSSALSALEGQQWKLKQMVKALGAQEQP